MITKNLETTTPSPEKRLTEVMLRGIGANTIRASRQDEVLQDRRDFEQLATAYEQDPEEVVAHAREEFFRIGQDTNLSPDEKATKLSTYLDAYFDLTIELDHRTFLETPPGEVRSGVPEYIPDGFIDMGKDSNIGASRGNREQIVVDKQAILEQHKPFLIDLLRAPYGNIPLEKRKEHVISALGEHVSSTLQYDPAIANETRNLGNGKVNLSEMPEGVCRHQALVFQVLCQTMGIKSRVLKAHRDGIRHSTNMVRLEKQWYIFDVTNPYYQSRADGSLRWLAPSAYPVDEPPKPGKTKRYDVVGKIMGDKHTYNAHDDMYWRIEH